MTQQESIEVLYKLYPTKCPIRGASSGKSRKHKQKIAALLKEYSFEELKRSIELYTQDCKKNQVYMKNFGTFLNNVPDPDEFEESQEIDIRHDRPEYK